MNRFFGNSKKEEVSLNDAITKIDGRVDSIEVKIKKLDAELAQCKEKMLKMPEGPSKNSMKQQALRILQQKRMYENQRGMMIQQSFNMEQTNFATETVKDTLVTVNAMKTATKEMKASLRQLDVDKIERMQDDMQDLLDESNEVQELLSRSYMTPDFIDDADLDAELAALESEPMFEDLEARPSYLEDLNTPESLPTAQKQAEQQLQ